MFKHKLPKDEQGFTLVEVLVAILLMTLFAAISMQGMVIAAIFKARAQEFTEATNWIQEDLETVKTSGAILQYTSLSVLAPVGSTIKVKSVYGFKEGDVIKVGTEPTNQTIATSGINTTNSSTPPYFITITPGLTISQSANQPVLATTRCAGATDITGLADHLRDWITDTNPVDGIDYTTNSSLVTTTKTSSLTNKIFTFKRTVTVTPSSPFNVLQLSYNILTTSSTPKSIAKINTEVIPDVAFSCP